MLALPGLTIAQSSFLFKSAEADFTLLLPAHWKETTRAEFDRQNRIFKQETGADGPQWAAGFHLAGNEPFVLPYVLIQRYGPWLISRGCYALPPRTTAISA